VGSYINAFYGVDGGIATGQGRTLAGGAQIAGSSLWINQYGTGSSSSSARVWSPGSSISASVNSSTFPSSGMTTLTGTWRVVQPSVYVARSDVGCGNAQSYWFSVFFVRVA
jgi:hypothetical protein